MVILGNMKLEIDDPFYSSLAANLIWGRYGLMISFDKFPDLGYPA